MYYNYNNVEEQVKLLKQHYIEMYELSGATKPEWALKNETPKAVFTAEKKDNTLNVVMDGPIDDVFGLNDKKIISELDKHPDSDINLRLTSPGGFLFQGMNLYGYLSERAKKNKLSIQGQGLVGSAAAVMFLAAETENRTLADGTMYFLHGTQGGLLAFGSKGYLRKEFDKLYETMESTDENLSQILSSRTEISDENIKNWIEGQKFLNKKDAIENGVATGDPQAEKGDNEGDTGEEATNELDDDMKACLNLIYKEIGELKNDR